MPAVEYQARWRTFQWWIQGGAPGVPPKIVKIKRNHTPSGKENLRESTRVFFNQLRLI